MRRWTAPFGSRIALHVDGRLVESALALGDDSAFTPIDLSAPLEANRYREETAWTASRE